MDPSAFPSLRRAMGLVTARRMHADGLLTEGEFSTEVARVLLEVGIDGLVLLLASQAMLTSLVTELLVGDDLAGDALARVGAVLSACEAAAS